MKHKLHMKNLLIKIYTLFMLMSIQPSLLMFCTTPSSISSAKLNYIMPSMNNKQAFP